MSREDRAARRGARRIYAELVPHGEVVRPRVTSLLRAFGLDLVLAVRPTDVTGLGATLRALGRAEVPVVLWPMASDDEGRWASLEAAAPWAAHAGRVLDVVAHGGAPATGVMLDLEPPLRRVRALLAGPRARDLGAAAFALVAAARTAEPAALEALRGFVDRSRALGLGVSAAVVPPLLFGGAEAARAWEAALGTPCSSLAPDHVSVMAYTTLLEGYSRGAVRRVDARTILRGLALRARAAPSLGATVGLSLGAVGPGALGDEPTYPSPDVLADDVEVARSAGASELTLFELAGVLTRPPAEAWLEAFVHGAAARPGVVPGLPDAVRARWALAAADGISRLLGRVHAVRETRQPGQKR